MSGGKPREVIIPVNESLQRTKAKEHIFLKLKAVRIMSDTNLPMVDRTAAVLKIVKHRMYLPIIKLMAGIK